MTIPWPKLRQAPEDESSPRSICSSLSAGSPPRPSSPTGWWFATTPAKTAANIVANKSLYRLGFTIFMLEMVAQVGVSALFYDLLKPVNRSLARISAIIGLTGCGIKTLARLFYYAPLILLGGAS